MGQVIGFVTSSNRGLLTHMLLAAASCSVGFHKYMAHTMEGRKKRELNLTSKNYLFHFSCKTLRGVECAARLGLSSLAREGRAHHFALDFYLEFFVPGRDI